MTPDRETPQYADIIKTYADNGATVQYSGDEFNIDISNSPQTYELPSTGGPGINILRTIGALLTGFSSLLLVSWVYRRREE